MICSEQNTLREENLGPNSITKTSFHVILKDEICHINGSLRKPITDNEVPYILEKVRRVAIDRKAVHLISNFVIFSNRAI